MSDDVDVALRHLEHAGAAMTTGEWDAVDFHLRCARTAAKVDVKVRRHDYDVLVVWPGEHRKHSQLVRVIAASRVLAHDTAQVWARANIPGITPDTKLLSTIEET